MGEVGAHRVQKRIQYPLELELQGVVNHLMWVLGTELWSSERAAMLSTNGAVTNLKKKKKLLG